MSDNLKFGTVFDIKDPVMAGFYADRSFLSSIAGPIGSGKTTAGIAKCFAIGMEQHPNAEKWRHIKVAVVRDTYPNLWKSTIPTFRKYIDTRAVNVETKGTEGRQYQIKIKNKLKDGTILEIVFDFMALGDGAVDDLLGGYEATIIWLDEAADLSVAAIDFCKGRVGRYPAGILGKCNFACVLLTFNKKDIDHWIYKYCVDEIAENHTFFDQPGGIISAIEGEKGSFASAGKFWKFNPKCENSHNLTPSAEQYYTNAAIGSDLSTIQRMHCNVWAASKDGTPVFPEFDDAIHTNPNLTPIENLPIVIGVDGGFTPGVVFLQQDNTGRIAVLSEIVMFGTETMSATQLGQKINQVIAQQYPTNPVHAIYTDPANNARGHDAEQMSIQDHLRKTTNLRVLSAPVRNNNISDRLEVVRQSLTTLINGKPQLVVGNCPGLKKGFMSGYHYKSIKTGDGEMSDSQPNKMSASSHIHDALQYGLLGLGLVAKNRDRNVNGGVVYANTEINAWGD